MEGLGFGRREPRTGSGTGDEAGGRGERFQSALSELNYARLSPFYHSELQVSP